MAGKPKKSQEPLRLRRIQELDVKNKRALVRVDFNVPLKNGAVENDARLRAAIPTIKYLRDAGARIVLISHLGRPKGKAEPKYSLKPVAGALEKLVGAPVGFSSDCVGEAARKAASALKGGELLLMENLRFHPEEEAADSAFAKELAKLGEVFVQDAFGTIHRAHASTTGVPKLLPSAIGFLVQKELEFLDRVISNPARPFVAIIGGAKISDKLDVLMKLLEKVDCLLIGGGMAYTFLAAQGISIGKSLLEKDKVAEAQSVVEKSYAKQVQCLLPADHIVVREIKPDAEKIATQGMAIPPDLIGVDIGSRAIDFFKEEIAKAKTVFWNGPMGISEIPAFAEGSMAIARALAEASKNGAVTIVGGGDSLAALARAKVSDKITHCSTGGGASLELIEGKVLPGLAALAS